MDIDGNLTTEEREAIVTAEKAWKRLSETLDLLHVRGETLAILRALAMIYAARYAALCALDTEHLNAEGDIRSVIEATS